MVTNGAPSVKKDGRLQVGLTPLAKGDFAGSLAIHPLWAETRGDRRVCVAILDGPVDVSHPCLQGAALTQIPTLVSGTATNGPSSQHGTHVASIIFGQPGTAITGIARIAVGSFYRYLQMILKVREYNARNSI
jgi:subtilisin family serine protease